MESRQEELVLEEGAFKIIPLKSGAIATSETIETTARRKIKKFHMGFHLKVDDQNIIISRVLVFTRVPLWKLTPGLRPY